MLFAASIGGGLLADTVNFETFYIRNSNAGGATISAPWDSTIVLTENSLGDGFSAVTPLGGQKVGYGTSAFDGFFANKLQDIAFDFVPPKTKPDGTKERELTPYLNMWVTDGAHYAVLAVDPNLNLVNFTLPITQAGLYEYEGKFGTAAEKKAAAAWLFKDGQSPDFKSNPTNGFNGYFDTAIPDKRFSFSSLKDTIYLDDPGVYNPTYVSSGAPRGGYGFNLIFGDTAANYVGSMGISNLKVTFDGREYAAANPVPDSGSTFMGTLFAVGLLGWITRRRKS